MLKNILPGNNIPNDINVIIEISSNNSDKIKYEFDKCNNILVVDRFLSTPMQYPCNYGFIPNTLSDDNDPLDVLVISDVSLMPGIMINCRPIGAFAMIDESGNDLKIVAVPNNNITKMYNNVHNIYDFPELLLEQIKYFFCHYKDLDSNKWSKIGDFKDLEYAKSQIIKSIEKI